MPRIVCFTVSILLLTIITSFGLKAQDKMVARDGFEKGYKAVQFGIGNNFRLTNLGDANFSFVKFRSSEKAVFLRGSISNQVNIGNNESDSEAVSAISNTSVTTEDSGNSKVLISDLKVYLGTINYLGTKSDVLPFISKSFLLGVGIDTGSSERDIINQNSSLGSREEINYENSDFGISPLIGASFGFGVEYFVSKNISLHAQTALEFNYRFSFTNGKNSRKITDNGTIVDIRITDGNLNNHSFFFGSSGVVFGLSAYF